MALLKGHVASTTKKNQRHWNVNWTQCKLKQQFIARSCSSAKNVIETSICVLFCSPQQCCKVKCNPKERGTKQTWGSASYWITFGQAATRQNTGTAHKPYWPLAKQQLGMHGCGFAERSCWINDQKKTTANSSKMYKHKNRTNTAMRNTYWAIASKLHLSLKFLNTLAPMS